MKISWNKVDNILRNNFLRNLRLFLLLEIHLLQKKLLKLGKNMNQFYGRKCLFQKNTSAAYLRINILGCLVPVWRLPRPSWSMHFGDVSEIHGLLGRGSRQTTWNSFTWTHEKWYTGNQCGQRYNASCKVAASVCVCVFFLMATTLYCLVTILWF